MRTRLTTTTSPTAGASEPGLAEGQQRAGQLSDSRKRGGVASTRTSRTWVKVMPALLLLAVILLFVFENLRSTKVSFATASGRLPLALALLAAAALGGLLVFALGSIRIMQLRKVIHRSPNTKRP
jgi:uncharacterized integral membrane protein